MSPSTLVAIDQGTTSSRAIAFTPTGSVVAVANQEFPQIFPQDGWVEHDPEAIWNTTLAVCREVIENVRAQGHRVAAIGLTNQRETTLVWSRETGACLTNAIVWQDRRTAAECERLRATGVEEEFTAKTGLLLDPYFSGTKLAWILKHVDGAAEAAAAGELAFGTVDTFLLWRLTGGRTHVTDATNASRTLMLNIHTAAWDEQLLQLLQVPREMLPEVTDSVAEFGVTEESLFGEAIPIRSVVGDQQAALVGQACLEPGMVKSTYGTGCFMMLNVGPDALQSHNQLLSTIGYRLEGQTTFALEGAIFNAGAAMQWLRDKLQIIESAADSEAMAASLEDNRGVYLVPAFTGLGAPHWDPAARAGLFGMTRDTGRAEIVRATLESVAYQTDDLLTAIREDGAEPNGVRIDGGMAANNWFAQFLADVTGVPVHRSAVTEATAWGAAALAGVGCGLLGSCAEIAQHWRCDRTFEPRLSQTDRERLLTGWREAVARVKTSR